MKFPYSMLLDFVDTALDAARIGDLLTMAGFELEGIEQVAGEPVLDIKVMSNRGDGLSVFGLAREVLAKDSEARPTLLYERAVRRFDDVRFVKGPAVIDIQTENCARYGAALFDSIPGDSPNWMQDRLSKAGMRPISLLVDISNYVMLEIGQPLHAFDRDKLAQDRIFVREAKAGEKIVTLNGEPHNLATSDLVICDAEGPVGVAGVMGGLETEVTPGTSRVLLESANFKNTAVRRTRKRLGLSTEASYRFERSVDPELVVAGLARFADLLSAAVGTSMGPVSLAEVSRQLQHRPEVRLRVARAKLLLGMEISVEQAEHYLKRLGFDVNRKGDELWVAAPSWRPDIEREEDLVEELGRVHGYDKIPEMLPQGTSTLGGSQGIELWLDWLREAALRCGFSQVVSHGLRARHALDDPDLERIGPRETPSPESAYLRNSLLPSLADAAQRNNSKESHIYELGRVFGRDRSAYVESRRVGFLSVGPSTPSSWDQKSGNSAGFFTLKGALQAIFQLVGIDAEYLPPTVADVRFHPGRQAGIYVGSHCIGLLGQIHPELTQTANLAPDTVLAEVWVEDAYSTRSSALRVLGVSRFPSVRRDIAVEISKEVAFQRISEKVKASAGEFLERQWLFDQFEGQGIAAGNHSLGIAMQLRKPDGTFTDEEANLVREIVVEALATLGATPR